MHTSSELTKPVNTLSMYIVHLRLFNSGSSLTFIMVGSEGPYTSASSKPTLFDWKHIYVTCYNAKETDYTFDNIEAQISLKEHKYLIICS